MDTVQAVEINDAGCRATTESFGLGELVRQMDGVLRLAGLPI